MLKVVHKNVTFHVDPRLLSLVWPGGSCQIPGSGTTSLKAEKNCIVIEASPETFRFTWNGPKDWILSDITSQEVVYPKRPDVELGPVRRKKG